MQMPAKRAVLVFLCLLALATSAQAVPPPWMALGPFGGGVRSLAADPTNPNTLYAATAQGIFRTTDGGSSWITLYTQEVTSNVAVDPAHPSTLYAGASGSILIKSTDGGASWTPSNSGLPFQQGFAPTSVQIDPADPRRLLLVHIQRLWRSVDAGASWQRVDLQPGSSQFLEVSAVAFAARPAGTAFAATAGGLYRSSDGGASWKLAGHGLPVEEVTAVAVAPSDPKTVYASSLSGVFRSVDGGFSWTRVTADVRVAIAGLAVSPRSPRTLYGISAVQTLSRSTDGGAHWTALSGVSDVTSVAFDRAAPATVYAGISHLHSFVPHPFAGVLRSDDGGASWTDRNQGITAIPVSSVAVDPGQPDQLWATGFTLFHSANRGVRWVRAPTPQDKPGLVAVGASSVLFAIAPHLEGPHGPLFDLLWRTSDGGAAWSLSLNTDAVLAFQIAPSDLSTAYAVGPGVFPSEELFRSTDDGAHWDPRTSSPLPFNAAEELAVAPSSASVLYLWGFLRDPPTPQRSLALLRSDDGGATWTDVTAGLPAVTSLALAVDPGDPHTVYAGTSEGIWKSTDGGGTWALAGSGLVHRTINQILSPLPGRLYAIVDGDRIFRSDDGGDTWRQWIRGLRTSAVSSLVADPSDPRRIYAATANGVWTLTETD